MPADETTINLTHHFLIAMPGLEDEAFAKTVKVKRRFNLRQLIEEGRK